VFLLKDTDILELKLNRSKGSRKELGPSQRTFQKPLVAVLDRFLEAAGNSMTVNCQSEWLLKPFYDDTGGFGKNSIIVIIFITQEIFLNTHTEKKNCHEPVLQNVKI
jgi:hypothetical protein